MPLLETVVRARNCKSVVMHDDWSNLSSALDISKASFTTDRMGKLLSGLFKLHVC